MDPDTGRMTPLESQNANKAFRKMFEANSAPCVAELENLQKQREEEIASGGEIEVIGQTLTEMEIDGALELLTQRAKGECPVFQEGEVLSIRGAAFRVGRITARGMMLRPVRDADLIP